MILTNFWKNIVIIIAVGCQFNNAKVWVHAQVSPNGIRSGQNGTRTGFSDSPSVFPISIILLLSIHSCIIWRMDKELNTCPDSQRLSFTPIARIITYHMHSMALLHKHWINLTDSIFWTFMLKSA